MSPEEFRLIRDAINAHCGLFFDDRMKYLLERRLSRRVEQRLLRSFREYEQFLRYDPHRDDEFSELVELLTTQETYFFRERYQMDALTREVLPEILERKKKTGNRTLRIWSAGCSTGEEPYTLAIVLSLCPLLRGWEWEVFASDISRNALQKARNAVYRPHSFRGEMPPEAARYFRPADGGLQEVVPEIRARVNFSAINLLDKDRLTLVRRLDAVFCRNVIIYFDSSTKRKVADLFYEKLEPGGFLFLGHSESLINLSTKFELRHFENDMIYQRPLQPGGKTP